MPLHCSKAKQKAIVLKKEKAIEPHKTTKQKSLHCEKLKNAIEPHKRKKPLSLKERQFTVQKPLRHNEMKQKIIAPHKCANET